MLTFTFANMASLHANIQHQLHRRPFITHVLVAHFLCDSFPLSFPSLLHPPLVLSDWAFAVGYFKLHPSIPASLPFIASCLRDWRRAPLFSNGGWHCLVFPCLPFLFISASISVKGPVSSRHPKIIYPLIRGYAVWCTPVGCCDCKRLAAAFWCNFWAWIQREHEWISTLWVMGYAYGFCLELGGKIFLHK